MSRADASERIIEGAVRLGIARGVGAMSLQAIATASGVSKALVLYHFQGKATLLRGVVDSLARGGAARFQRASQHPDPMAAWRALALDEVARGDAALLTALSLEEDVDVETSQRARAAREEAATALAVAVLGGVGQTPRVPAPFLGRLMLRQIDGLAVAAARGGVTDAARDAELDTFALALLALGK
ncbi:MAG: TetR/AcrR family transcriptional regulator [Gemmatimonadaceae bacterium]